jgi:GTP-binding protein
MRITILGRTNVGKSKLFNALSKRNMAIVFDQEDTTKDYISITIGGKILTDTVGIKTINDLKESDIVQMSDVLLYVVSDQIQNVDVEAVRFLQKQKKQNLYVVINKIDKKEKIEDYEKLGAKKVFFVSAENAIGLDEINEELEISRENIEKKITIALLGRCNVGKSTLMNCLVGYNRVKTSAKAGTTRDSIRESVETNHYLVEFMDTAGYRTESDLLEHITAKRRKNSLKYCNGSIVLLNGEEGLTRLDKTILKEAIEETGFVIIVINKMELIKDNNNFFFNFCPKWLPVVEISAINKDLNNLLKVIDLSISSYQSKLSTSELNKWLHDSNNKLCLRNENKRIVKPKYITQVETKPPTFALGKHTLDRDSIKQINKKLTEHFNIIATKIQWKMIPSKNPYDVK